MDFSIDMLSLGNADSFIIWTKENQSDYVTIIDGGNPGDAEKVISHYEEYIKPNVPSSCPILIINTHPHKDHIGGLIDIVHYFKNQIVRFYYNDPADYLNQNQRNVIKSYSESLLYKSVRIQRIYEALKDSESLSSVLAQYGIGKLEAFSDSPLDHTLFSFVSPSREFYLQQLAYFSDAENIKTFGSNTASESEVNEVEEGLKPCTILDEKNDTSAENLTSVITKFVDSSNRKYLFTADSGVDSFESANDNGFDISNIHICQLPHHGSRRNINTNWVGRFNPQQFWVSANGSKKHPRKAVISCIKKNLPNCKTYGTHKGGTKHINSKTGLFPKRSWSSANPI